MIDLNNAILSDTLINSDKFQLYLTLIYDGLAPMKNIDYYQLYTPYETDWRQLTLKEKFLVPLPYFTIVGQYAHREQYNPPKYSIEALRAKYDYYSEIEGKSEEFIKELDLEIESIYKISQIEEPKIKSVLELCKEEYDDKSALIRRTIGIDAHSPYFYALGHHCGEVALLELLMARDLFPDKTWNIVETRPHVFIMSEDGDIFDIMICEEFFYEDPKPISEAECLENFIENYYNESITDLKIIADQFHNIDTLNIIEKFIALK